MKKVFHFFIYSNLFIALCAVAMVVQTYTLFLHTPVNRELLFFTLFATFCSYSFHWGLTGPSADKSSRIEWLHKYRYVHVVLFIAGLAGSLVYFFKLWPYGEWLFLSMLVTFLYSAPKIPHPLFRSLRKVAFGKTIFLAMVWMHVTTVLPIIISGVEWRPALTLFVIGRFFFIYAVCILFDFRDREYDKAEGIRSFITFLDKKGISWLFRFSLIIFFGCTILLAWFELSIPAVIVLLVPGIILAALYKSAIRNFSDIYYYFVLDGLMAFSALLTLIPGNWLNLQT